MLPASLKNCKFLLPSIEFIQAWKSSLFWIATPTRNSPAAVSKNQSQEIYILRMKRWCKYLLDTSTVFFLLLTCFSVGNLIALQNQASYQAYTYQNFSITFRWDKERYKAVTFFPSFELYILASWCSLMLCCYCCFWNWKKDIYGRLRS